MASPPNESVISNKVNVPIVSTAANDKITEEDKGVMTNSDNPVEGNDNTAVATTNEDDGSVTINNLSIVEQSEVNGSPSKALNSEGIDAVTIRNVGGSGSYDRVTSMKPGVFEQRCPENACAKTPQSVSGSLAPFNEEMSLAFRGPMTISNVAVYTPSSDSSWTSVSSYDQGLGSSLNLVFMNNKGGEKSGIFTFCGGNSQSFASSNGRDSSASAQQFDGTLADGEEVQVVSGLSCASSSCDGYSRGETASHGWAGSSSGTKMFIIKAKMPNDGPVNIPAIWMLNSQVLQSAQYGCNCRGQGGFGGCGELDIAEVLPANKNKLTSTIYSFKGSIGAGEYADRPTTKAATFVVIFNGGNGSGKEGTIKILKLGESDVDFSGSIARSTVDEWLSISGQNVNFDI